MVISLTGLAGVAMVTGIKDYNKNKKRITYIVLLSNNYIQFHVMQ